MQTFPNEITPRRACGLEGLANVWKRHRETVRIAKELGGSSDRVLSDMGVARGDIAAIARGRYPGR